MRSGRASADDDGVVLVTGGASGIGAATVARLLDTGRHVVAVDRDERALIALQDAHAAAGSRLGTRPLDVTDEAAVESTVAAIASDARLSGLVNCAGTGRDARFHESSAELFRLLHEVNVIGTFLVAKASAAAMADTGGGSIVNLSSVSGIVGNAGRAAYGATKGAVVALSRVMAVELAADAIRVNVVAPGPIDTPLTQALHTDAMRAAWHDTVPMRRYGTPGEVAGTIAFLLDERLSAYVTGQVIGVDGGFLAAGVLS